MDRIFFALGSVLAALGVALGAFGAHGLKAKFAEHPDLGAIYQTAVQYHLIHALALLAVAWATTRWPSAWANAAGWAFALGIVLFSGSLYALVFTGLRGLGAITPVGGLCFLAGWVCLAVRPSGARVDAA